ncbi:YgzB family protein [Thalassobacillus pellis]|uniref:YgzB family protein n=1 Tax=Thalassobacillus pellis TaxID=748008 RepID=UPI0019615C19|nr:YgzB family protein [Thalassobacillus pellis]MBM7553865.1 membrane glycosyltransferase [Thalassobacillus pellis]
MALKYSSKINKIRTFALSLVFIGFAVMYVGLLFKQVEWVMILFMILGIMCVGLSTVVYFWIGMLSTKTIQIICPNCEKPTKMLGRVDACMHCKQPLTLDKSLEGKEFDEKYNSKRYQKQEARQSEQ